MLSTSLPLDRINREEALRYMGFRDGRAPCGFEKLVDSTEKELLRTAKPRFIWKIFPLCHDENGTLSAGGIKLSGNDINAHLEGCGEVVFMAATLSAHADMLIAKAQAKSMTDALIADALASAGIEQICNKAELAIAEELGDGRYMTWRFSPGYGDFPLLLQENILTVLDAQRKTGLTVTDSSVLIPTKSVTAVIGISDSPVSQQRRGCAVCTMRDRCQFRRKGAHCGNA